MHDSITVDRVMEACERRNTSTDNPGMCCNCGADVDGVEPDAENYECEICGEETVDGCETLLFKVA